MFPEGNPNRIILVVCLILGGFLFFGILSKIGEKYLNFIQTKQESIDTSNTSTTEIGQDNIGHVVEDNIHAVENGILRKVNDSLRY